MTMELGRSVNEFSWLLISDLHLKSDYATWSQSVVLRDMVRDIKRRSEEHPTIQFIIVSGDLAYAGKPEQYTIVESFLDDLIGPLQLDRSDVLIVPGNHDVDRDVQVLAFHGSRSQFTSANNVERFLSDPQERVPLLARLRAFSDFESDYCQGIERVFTDGRLAYISRRVVGGLPLAIVGLNSALACGDDDDRNIVVGDRPIIEVVENIREADVRLVIGILHHPPVWLREFDRRTLERRFFPHCDILHRGHLHESGVEPVVTSKETNCLVVAAGASYVGRQFKNSYSIVSLNVAAATCSVTNHEYENHSGKFRSAETQTHEVRLRGDVPGDTKDLVTAIQALNVAANEFAPYLAGLIDNRVSDIPLRLNGRLTFGAAGLLDPGDPFTKVTKDFLNTRNALLGFSRETSLADRIRYVSGPIMRYAERLHALAANDERFRTELVSRSEQANGLCRVHLEEQPSNLVATLDLLATEDDWVELAVFARRYQSSIDAHVRIIATMRLALALAHSENPEEQSEARSIADGLVDQEGATEECYELAFAINRRHGESEKASQLLVEAVDVFGNVSPSFCRSGYAFAAETGITEVKEKLDVLKG